MAMVFKRTVTWDEFWSSQCNNPEFDMPFLYRGKVYYLNYDLPDKQGWGIYESGEDPECRGISAYGKCIAESRDENQIHKHRYPTNEEWNSMLNSCYAVLTTPIWDGKSFKDVIADILFDA